MWTKVIRDYFVAFRWQQIKESYSKGAMLWLLYWIVGIPLIMQHETIKEDLAYCFVMVPILFCMFAEPLHATLLPKMLYLCPMSRGQRREYILRTCCIRVAVPLIVGILGVVGLLVCGCCDWVVAGGVLLNISVFCAFLGTSVLINGSGILSNTGTVSNMAGILDVFLVCVALLLGLLQATWMDGISKIVWLKWAFLAVEILILVPMAISYSKRWQGALDRALSYEREQVGKK